MIKKLKNIFLFVMLLSCFTASAQVTGSSPYSQFGLGNLKESLLPQNRGMGGISTGIRRIGAYNNINFANPASYSDIRMTTFDVGLFSGLTKLDNSSVSMKKPSFNASLSHINFAIPITKKSTASFGLVPYTNLGYQYRNAGKVDTTDVNYIYSGDGGLSKAYLGYGFQAGKHFSIGVNASYIFGKLNEGSSTVFPDITGSGSFLNSKNSKITTVGGLSYDYGIQYYAVINKKTKFTLGYSGSSASKIASTITNLTTRYFINTQGEEINAADTTFITEGGKTKIKLPMMNSVGFSFERENQWLAGAEFSMGNWSGYREGDVDPGLKNSYTARIGGQFTPDITSVNYLKVVDYRFGFKYEKTYINIRNIDIKDAAFTFGLGLPLPSNRGQSFYKINFATELGQKGSRENGLVRERYANFYIGFTLNDQWFQKFKFD